MADNGPSIRELIARLAALDETVAATPARVVDYQGVSQVNPVLRDLALEELRITRTLELRRRELRGSGPGPVVGVPSSPGRASVATP